jgi:hypothetical protein
MYNCFFYIAAEMLNLMLFTGDSVSTLEEKATMPGPIGITAELKLNIYALARYVKLQINGSTALHVCEVEIYTINVPSKKQFYLS